MPDEHDNKRVLRWVITGIAVIWSLGVWCLWLFESHSYLAGPQDFGLPLTFKSVYFSDVIVYSPQALLFDAAVAVLIVVSVAYCFWRWSTSWSTGQCTAFVLGSAIFAASTSIQILSSTTWFPLNLIALSVVLIAVPITWLICVAYASVISSRRVFGEGRAHWLPILLTVVVSGMVWLCQPQDIFRSEPSPENTRALGERLSDGNPRIRALALSALRDRGPYDEPTASAIIHSMSDSDNRVQAHAFSLVADLGPYAIKAVPDLKEKLPASTDYDRLGICRALWKIEGNAKDIVPMLIELLDHEFGPIRVDAAELLGVIGPESKDAVPKLRAMVAYVPKVETPQPIDETLPIQPPRDMTEAEFYPQIRDVARVALSKIVQPE